MRKNHLLRKRIFSIIMTLIMVVSMMPASVWAAENETSIVENAVAEVTIGTTTKQYTDIKAAFEAAQKATGATVKLLKGVTTTSPIAVSSGTFTIDLNGMKWERSSGHTLWVQGTGNVTVTSTQSNGTIWNDGNNAIFVEGNATVHVTSGVRLNQLCAMQNVSLTLDTGVIITRKIWTASKGANIAPFLTGKALQACGADYQPIADKYVSIYQNYDETDTGCVIVIEHKSCAGTADNTCEICGYDGTQDKPTEPTEPEDPYVAEVNGTKYKTLAEAIKEANGKDITLLKIFGKNVTVDDSSIEAGIILGTGGKDQYDHTYPSYWIAESNGIPLTMNAGEITLKEGVLAQFGTGANNNIAIKLNGGTLTVADTVTKIIGGSADSTPENTAQMAAIKATGGVLDLQGNTHLDGGLIMMGGAKLKNKLTAGTFTNSGSSTASVSVKGTSSYLEVSDSTEYNTVFDLLAEGYAFAKYNADGTTGAVIAKNDSKSLTEDVTVIKCTHKGANNKSLFKDDTCTGCGFVCDHQNVVSETGKCSVCGTQINVANVTTSDDDTKSYATLAAAIEAAEDNGTVILLTNVEENITITDGMKVTIDLNEKTWKGSGTTWQATVPLTVKGGSVTVKNGTLNQGGASSYANSAVKLESGSLIVGDGMTIRGANYDSDNYRSAIDVQSGQLTLRVGTNLIYGMKVAEGKTLADYLPTNTAFYQAGHVITGDGEYFDSESAKIINGYVQEKTGDFMLTVVAHPTHDLKLDSNGKYTCACGFDCAHSSFTNGKCTVCGYECPHPSAAEAADGKYTCDVCKEQMAVKVEMNGESTYYAARHNGYNDETLWWLFNNALESGSTVTLLADNLYAWAFVSGGKQITLNLNGKTLDETIQGITVGRDNHTDTTSTNNKLIVTGTLGACEVAKDNCYAFRTWEGGELNLKEVADGGKIGSIIADGGKVTTEDSTSDMKIGTLYINDGSTDISFRAGTFDKITGNNTKTLGDLLAEENPIQKSGKAFKYTTGNMAFVPYDTQITSSGVENVTITDCSHDSITSGTATDGITYGTCDNCGMDKIAAVLTDANDSIIKTYTISDGADIFSTWAKDGGKLKLYSDLTFNDYLGQQGGTTEMVIDLNGHEIKLPDGATGQEVTLNGGSLTITDSSSGKKGRFAATLRVCYTASLTVDGVAMGTIGLMKNTASITLKEGTTFTAIDASVAKCQIVEFLQGGCYIVGDSNADVDLMQTSISSENGFTVKQLPGTVTADKKIGEIRYGSNKIADKLLPTVTMNGGSKPQLTYEWYYNTDSGAKKLITVTKSENDTAYNMEKGAWSNLYVGDELDVFCIVSSETDGTHWKTPVKGYTLTVTAGDLTEASVTLGSGDKLIYTPGDSGSEMQTLDFVVEHNGVSLTKGTDYEIADSSNQATDAGKHILTLTGKGNYAGSTLEYEWNIAKRELTGIAKITKTYDGTSALPDQITFAYNGDVVTLTSGEDYTATGEYHSAGAGTSKGANANIMLKNTNYTFANNETTKEFLTSESISNAEITKAKAPSDIEAGTITVYNNRTADYGYNVPKELLPKLTDGKRYGNEIYTSTWNSTDSNYKVTASDIDEHGQLYLRVEAPDVNDEKQIGSFTITVKSENYEDFTLTVNVNAINKLTPTGSPTLRENEITYGYSVNTISLSGDMKYGEATVSGSFAWIDGNAIPDAGSYEAEWKFTPNEDIYKEVTGETTITVNKATLTGVSVQQTGALEYNSNAQTATVDTKATAVNGQNVTFTYSGSEDGTYSDKVPAFKDAGTYTVYYKAAAANHETATGSFTVTIAAKELTIKEVTIKNKVYDGEKTAEIDTVTFNGLVGSETVEYTASDVKFNSANVKDANKVTGTITLNEDVKNYVLPAGNFEVDAKISKAAATCVAEPTAETLTYNGEEHPLVKAGTADGGTLVYSIKENGIYSTEIPTGTEAKTYAVWYKVIGDENHNDTALASVSVTINKAAVTITAKDKTVYVGEKAPDLSNPKLDKDYTVSELIGEDKLTIALTLKYVDKDNKEIVPDTSKTGEAAKIDITGDSEDSNYAITYVAGTLTVANRPAGGGAIEDDVKTTTDTDTSQTTTSTTIKDTKTETVKDDNGNDISKITATVSDKVADKLVDQAVSNKSDTVEITVKSDNGNKVDSEKQIELEIPKSAVKDIADKTDASLIINTDNGQVVLDNKTLETIVSETEGDTVKIAINENTQLKEAQKPAADVIDSGKLFDVAVYIGNKRIHDLNGGKVEIWLPIPEKLKDQDIAVVYINDKGICEILNHTVKTVGAENFAAITVSHFSNFAVVKSADAEKLIKQQNQDKAKDLIKEAKLAASTSKTSKKNVKVTIGVKIDKSLIKELKSMGYTVKYKYYRSTKKASKYTAVKTKTGNTYINTSGKKGTKYYYKAKVLVYDGKNLIAQTALKQCSYGVRTWSK